MKSNRLPFQNLSREEWSNLLLAAITVYYVLKVIMEIYHKNVFMFLGGDFLSFWSAGLLANLKGYEASYDLTQLSAVEFAYIPKPSDLSSYQFIPLPTYFLPLFLTPFQILARFPIVPGFILWSLFNLLGYIIYLIFYSRVMKIKTNRKLILSYCLFWPAYLSLFWGQITLFLVIPIGEFYRAFIEEKYIRSGLWLGLLMIKPQLLIFIIPLLIIQSYWKVMLGFLLSAFMIVTLSLTLAGWDGIISWFNLIVNNSDIWSISVGGMPNWRMIGAHMDRLNMGVLGILLSDLGIFLTVILVLYIFRRRANSEKLTKQFLGIFSATGLVSWHYHIHSNIVLVPLLLSSEISLSRLFYGWITIPAIVSFGVDVTMFFEKIGYYKIPYNHMNQLVFGITGFTLQLITVIQTIRNINTRNLTQTTQCKQRNFKNPDNDEDMNYYPQLKH